MRTSVISSNSLRNFLHSLVLFTGMMALLSLVGWLLMGPVGIGWFLFTGIVILIGATRISPRVILLLHGARLLRTEDAPNLYKILNRLSVQAGIKNCPILYYIPDTTINVFTSGLKENTSIALSYGIVRQLNVHELTGVLAHEISHIRSNDMLVMLVASVISSLTSVMALAGSILVLIYIPLYILTDETVPWALLIIMMLAPTASALMQMALSRTREFSADLDAVKLTNDPLSLASALEKIEYYQSSWLEKIFKHSQYIRIPLLLRTHPLVSDRVDRLKDLAIQLHDM
ncbi:MAG: zinc metalloprotease HtpX [Gammaproteobacteria bacterium]|nr:zinc metalloprotease HtpX [Gammaproteobacteria bacterium]